jgi:hypothetical protein
MNLEIIRRDDVIISVTITDHQNNAVNLTDSTVYFTVKQRKTDADADALISVEVTNHTNPNQGQTEISLTGQQTNLTPRSYFYDIQVKDNDDKIRSVEFGIIKVIQDVTIRTN